MKKFITTICIVLVLSICMVTPASAAEITAPYASSFFGSHKTYLWETSNSSFQVWFTVTAVAGMSELGVDHIDIERSSDGVNWTVVKTYDSSDYPSLIATNTSGHSGYVTYSNMLSGYEYRAYVQFYAKNSSGSRGYNGAYAYF